MAEVGLYLSPPLPFGVLPTILWDPTLQLNLI